MSFLHYCGFRFPITILHIGYMSIGWQTKTFDEWREFIDFQNFGVSENEFNLMRECLLPQLDFMEKLHKIGKYAEKVEYAQ